jgi:molybdenum cofactor synthesis domain-containing protein
LAYVFHRLVRVGEAIRILEEALGGIRPLGVEKVELTQALGRVLAENVSAEVDSPPFDRSTVDGYAVNSADVYEASEATPVKLRIVGEVRIGSPPELVIGRGEAARISTGAVVPRGSDAVVMVEYTKEAGDYVLIYRQAAPGENISTAGSDAARGDMVLRKGRVITPKEIAALVGTGVKTLSVYLRPRIAVYSVGDELVSSSEELSPGKVIDVNGPTLTALASECGAEARFYGILPDDYESIVKALSRALEAHDVVITSGSTSAGYGDVIYRVFNELGRVLVHGLNVKPGKPTVIGVSKENKVLLGLPGFPLSAMIIFNVLARPILVRMTGATELEGSPRVRARFPFRLEAGGGKTEYIPVQLVETHRGLVAYPLLAGSGSATALAVSDGFVTVSEERQFIDEDEEVEVSLLTREYRRSELNIIGSHCPAVDLLLDLAGISNARIINVGSLGGWRAVKRGEADIAGTHLLNSETGEYNVHMVGEMGLENKVAVFRGYGRRIGLIVGRGNPLQLRSLKDIVEKDLRIVNRVKGSGMRQLLDMGLKGLGVENPEKRIKGYTYQVGTHNAVAIAVNDGRADCGIGIEYAAWMYGLDFIPIGVEIYDFVVRIDRLSKQSVQTFLVTLSSDRFKDALRRLSGYTPLDDTGKRIV